MRWKSTVALLLITIGVGAYISLYEIKQPSKTLQKRLAKQIIALDAESISHIRIESPEINDSFTLEASGWRRDSDQRRASFDMIDEILSHLHDLKSKRTLSATADESLDLETFGLTPPAASLLVTHDDQNTLLRLGSPTPIHENRYLSIESKPEVFVISNSLFESMNKPTDSFIDQFLIHIDNWKVEELKLSSPTAVWSIGYDDKGWLLVDPLIDRAHRKNIVDWFDRLASFKVLEITNTDLETRWGFDEPTATISIKREGEEALQIVFGSSIDPAYVPELEPEESKQHLYVKRSDEPFVYGIKAQELTTLLVQPDHFRSRACFDFITTELKSISISQNEIHREFTRVDGVWRDATNDYELDNAMMAAWIGNLQKLSIAGFLQPNAVESLEAVGLEPALASITLKTINDEHPQTLLVGNLIIDQNSYYGIIENRPGLMKLSAGITEVLDSANEFGQ